MLRGIDIASYQATLNLDAISYDFVMIKATEGSGYVNPYCDRHYQAAKRAGKKRAVYHFASFTDPIVEANWFVKNCRGYIRDAIFVLDWEGAQVGRTAFALQFLQRVEELIGYKPAIYMSEYVENHYDWRAVVRGNYGLIAAKYADYEIDNDYDTSHAGLSPKTKYWPFYFMWQWTSKGRLKGYAGDLDCDIAYLSREQWDKYAGVQYPAPPASTVTTTTAAPVTATTTSGPPAAPDPQPAPTTQQPPLPGLETTTTSTAAPVTATTTQAAPKAGWWAIVWAVIRAIFSKGTKN